MSKVENWPVVYLIMLTFNGKHHLESCLPSVLGIRYPELRMVLVDNASSDGSHDYVKSHFPQIRVFRNSSNLGFAKANNRAVKLALKEEAKYIFLLNDDAVILDPECLQEAVRVAEKDRTIGMVGFQVTEKQAEPGPPTPLRIADKDRMDACALLIRGSLFEKIGFFDEVYFAYAEEDDFEARALRAGYRLVQLNIPVYHVGGGTSSKTPFKASYLQIRNSVRYSIKNRRWTRTFLRIFRFLDVACNPFPFSFDPLNPAHRRIRASGNLCLNFLIYLSALIWNLLFLPQTLLIKHREGKKLRERWNP